MNVSFPVNEGTGFTIQEVEEATTFFSTLTKNLPPDFTLGAPYSAEQFKKLSKIHVRAINNLLELIRESTK